MAVINLKTIPDEVLEHLLKVQGQIKAEKRLLQYSLEKTVYQIIKEHKKLKEK